MSPPESPAPERDIYAAKPFWRWLALLAALLAWGFDGVEQGVYTVMTREALKDLIPGITDLVSQAADLKAQLAGTSGSTRTQLMGQLGPLTRQIDASVGPKFSLSLAMWMWGAAVGGVIFGRLGDRLGRVKTLLLSVSVYASFTGLSALSTHWSHFVTCRFFGAMGLGGTWPLCVALVVETWPESRRTLLAGAIGAAANVGFFLAATYSRLMVGYSWRWVIGMGFFIGISSLPLIFFVPEPTKWKLSRARKERSSLADLFSPAYRRSTIVGSLLSTVALLGTWGSFLWLATYVDQITEGAQNQEKYKSIASQWQAYGQMIGGFLGGLAAGWLGNRRSYLLLSFGAWATVTGLFFFNTHFSWLLLLMGTLAGLFVTGFFGWLPKFLPELYPTRIRSSGQGFCYNIGRVLTGVGVFAAGELVRVYGGDYRKAAITIATVYLTGLIIIWFAPDTGGKMRDDEVGAPLKGPVPGLEAAAAARPEKNA